MSQENQTLGQKRVKAEFNPAKNGTVDELKNHSAIMIDIALKGKLKDSAMVDHFESFSRLFTINLSQDLNSEKNRLSRIAMKYITQAIKLWDDSNFGDNNSIELVTEWIETACMYAVKANFTE